MIYYTKQGDTLDLICHLRYGQASGYVEKVLEHKDNYRLSDFPMEFPIGTKVYLPEFQEEKNEHKLISIWE